MLSDLTIQQNITQGRGILGYGKGKGKKGLMMLSWAFLGAPWKMQNEDCLPWGWLSWHHLDAASGNRPQIHAPFAREPFPWGASCLLPRTEHHSRLFLILGQRGAHPNSAFQWSHNLFWKTSLRPLGSNRSADKWAPYLLTLVWKEIKLCRGENWTGRAEALEQWISISLK